MNTEIRNTIKESGFKQWQVANQIGVNEGTLCRWLRVELTPEKKQLILNAIDNLKAAQ